MRRYWGVSGDACAGFDAEDNDDADVDSELVADGLMLHDFSDESDANCGFPSCLLPMLSLQLDVECCWFIGCSVCDDDLSGGDAEIKHSVMMMYIQCIVHTFRILF